MRSVKVNRAKNTRQGPLFLTLMTLIKQLCQQHSPNVTLCRIVEFNCRIWSFSEFTGNGLELQCALVHPPPTLRHRELGPDLLCSQQNHGRQHQPHSGCSEFLQFLRCECWLRASDQENVFDCVEHHFLWKSMERYTSDTGFFLPGSRCRTVTLRVC